MAPGVPGQFARSATPTAYRRRTAAASSASQGRPHLRTHSKPRGPTHRPGRFAYLTSWSSLNIGRYIARMIVPTMTPTTMIMIGSMIEVSAEIEASTSSS